jgi:hypothetical protein
MLDMVLRILGLITLGGLIGALIGLVITPFVLYLAYLVAYAIASMIAVSILRKRTLGRRLIRFQQFANPLNAIIYQSHNKEQAISYTKHIPDFRDDSNSVVYRNVVSHPPMTQKPSTPPIRQPIIIRLMRSTNQPSKKPLPSSIE